MANYLGNGDNANVLYADVYFKADGENEFRHMGIVDVVNWTPEIETAEKGWKGNTVATVTTSKGAALGLTLGETNWRNFRAAFMAIETDIIQAAGTISVTKSNVSAGTLLELGGSGSTDLVITDGTNPLVEGVDYKYDVTTDFAVMLTEQASVDASGTYPEITAGEQKALSLLAEDNGIKGEFKFIGENARGMRVLLSDIIAELRPSGDITISAESGTDFQTYEMTGNVLYNSANAQYPFGRLTQLS